MEDDVPDHWEDHSTDLSQPDPLKSTMIVNSPKKFQAGSPQHRLQTPFSKQHSIQKAETSKQHLPDATCIKQSSVALVVTPPATANPKVATRPNTLASPSKLPATKTTLMNLARRSGKLNPTPKSEQPKGVVTNPKPAASDINPTTNVGPKSQNASKEATLKTSIKIPASSTNKSKEKSKESAVDKLLLNEYGSNLGVKEEVLEKLKGSGVLSQSTPLLVKDNSELSRPINPLDKSSAILCQTSAGLAANISNKLEFTPMDMSQTVTDSASPIELDEVESYSEDIDLPDAEKSAMKRSEDSVDTEPAAKKKTKMEQREDTQMEAVPILETRNAGELPRQQK